jgi:hypothetical protein
MREVEPMSAPTLDLTGLIFLVLFVTIVLTPVLSRLMLWRYRRAVRRSIYATVPGSPQSVNQAGVSEGHGSPDPAPGGLPFAPVVALTESQVRRWGNGGAGWRLARRRMRSLCYVYAAAGVVYGLVACIVWLQAGRIEFGLRRFVVVAALFAWPAVATVLAVRAARRRIETLVWVGYVLLILLLAAGTGAGFEDILLLIVLIVVLPGLLLLAISGLNLRTLGPLLAAPMIFAVIGLVGSPWLGLPLVKAGTSRALAQAVAIVPILMILPAAGAYLWWTARQYARKRVSDQMLLAWQWLFLVTVFGSLLLLLEGLTWAALAFWLSYLGFRLVMAAGLRLRKRSIGGVPLRLLLLRGFGAQRRSERLLHRLGASWRHLGPVQMITGPDLIAATLEPHEFLDSLRGRLNRQFVVGPDDLRRRLAQLDLDPDPDGRYRVDQLFCHEDTWRPALQELAHRSDCTLIDLRGFSVARQGLTYEITQLMELVPLRRVLALTDDTTDHAYLRTVLDTAWRGMGSASPNRTEGGALQVLRVAHRGGVDDEAVVALLDAAASAAIHPLRPYVPGAETASATHDH